ncbi:hypothetical protein SAMN05880593_1078 [Rhizobium sp. RU36D]|nr:hypothetical protein SAMN05880593_1078 [Rhizobium sp. RU36D]
MFWGNPTPDRADEVELFTQKRLGVKIGIVHPSQPCGNLADSWPLCPPEDWQNVRCGHHTHPGAGLLAGTRLSVVN